MTWFDGIILLLVVAISVYELRQEAGRALLDTFGTLLAIHVTDLYSPTVGSMLHWKAPHGMESSPQAYLLLFIPAFLLALTLSFLVHRHLRWSLDQYDPVFGLALGVCAAIALTHVVSDMAVRSALVANPKLPDYLASSLFAEELRSFSTYHRVVAVLMQARTAG